MQMYYFFFQINYYSQSILDKTTITCKMCTLEYTVNLSTSDPLEGKCIELSEATT